MKNLESRLEKLMTDGAIENIAVKIGKGDVTFYETYHSKSGSVSQLSLFDMASVTKIVATTSLCLLAIDRRQLSVEDKVSRFFTCPADKEPLTIENLLTHTMGIGHKSLCQPGNSYDTIQNYILSLPLDVPIGSEVLYSCPAFILLGKILEKIFGGRLDKIFSEYIAGPLQMESTGFLPGNARDIVNSNLSKEEIGLVNDYNCRFLGGVAGNAGLFSNMSDMTRYVAMLQHFGQPLIRKETFDLAVQNYTGHLSESRGLGVLYVDERYSQAGGLFKTGSIGHCGHTGQSVFVDTTDGFYVIVLSDATISTVKKYGQEHYDDVIKMREEIHQAIKKDLT